MKDCSVSRAADCITCDVISKEDVKDTDKSLDASSKESSVDTALMETCAKKESANIKQCCPCESSTQ
jgi:hypothetical protein